MSKHSQKGNNFAVFSKWRKGLVPMTDEEIEASKQAEGREEFTVIEARLIFRGTCWLIGIVSLVIIVFGILKAIGV